MVKDYLIVIGDCMDVLVDFLNRISTVIDRCEISFDNRIPYVVIRSEPEKIEWMRTFVTILMVKDFLGRIIFLDRKDLES